MGQRGEGRYLMAQVVSGEVQCSTYIWARAVVDYNGRSATAHIQYKHTAGGYTGYSGSFTYGAGSASASGSWNNARVNTYWETFMSIGFTISAGGGTYDVWCSGYSYNDFTVSVSFPSQRTAPSGISCSNIRRGIEDFTATVSLSSWGNYVEDWEKYRELQCWTKSDSGLVEPRRWQATAKSSSCPLSGDITVSNSSSVTSGSNFRITGNTMYTLGVYASNSYASTGSQRVGNYTTLPYASTLSLNQANSDNLVLNCAVPANGGAYTQTVQYSIDGGTTWKNGTTVSGGSAQTVTFTIGGLEPNTQYTIQSRMTTSAGTTNNATITASTVGPANPTISVVNSGNIYSTQTVTYGTTTFGGGSGGKVFLYGWTNTPPTTLIDHKTTTGDNTFNNTGLAGNQIYYYRARAGAIFGSGKNYFVVPSSTTGRVNDNEISVTKTKSATETGGTAFTSIPVQLEPNTTYTLSYNKTITGDNLNRAGDVRLNIDGAWTSTWDSTGTLTFTTGGRGEMIFGFYNYFSETAAGSNTITWSNIQVEKGSSKTAFVGHNVDYVMSDYSPIVSLVTRLPQPTILSTAVLEYETASTVKVRMNVRVPADNGYHNTKDVYYRYSTDGGTTWTSWVSGVTVNRNTQTDVNIDIPNLAVDTQYRLSIRTMTPGQSNGSNTRWVDFTTSGQHQPPANFDYELIDRYSSIQNWLATFDGYVNPTFVQRQSGMAIRIPEATKGTCSDGATLTRYDAYSVVDNYNVWVRDFNYPVTIPFQIQSPVNRATDFPSNVITVQGKATDSLDTYTQINKTALCLSWEIPTITVSGERLSQLGTARVDITGTYARLQDNSLNNGNDCNTLEIQYRVLDLNNEVIIDWTSVSDISTTIDSEKPFLRDYTSRVNLSGVPSKSACVVEAKITDHFRSATSSYLLDIWDKSQVNDPVVCDIELWDWKTNTFVADLSYLVVGDLNITWELNDVEEVSFDMDLMEFEKKCHEMGVDSEDLLKPYAHDIRIRRNGEYILGCQLVEVNIQITNNPPSKIQVKGTGFLNLLKDQYVLSEAWSGYTYAQIARRLVESAQKPDCLIKNPTGDIDTSYWLSPHGTVAYNTGAHSGGGCISGSRSGAGWISAGSQMNTDTGQAINIDAWVKGQSGVVCYVREREYLTVSNTQQTPGQITLNGDWQHIQINNYMTFFEDGYILFECNRTDTSTPLRIDDCYIYPTNDDALLCNMNIPLGVDTASATQESNRQVNYELQNVKDALMDLTNMEDDNFEFEFLPDRTFNVYARKGEDKLDLEVGYPGNVDSMTVTRSAANVANKIIAIGSGIGDERLQTEIYNNPSRRTLGTREAVTTDNNISLESTLKSKAIGMLYDRKDPTNTPKIVIKDGSINPSNVETGDVILVEVGESDFIDSVTGEYRIMKIDYSLSEDAVEEMTLTVEPPMKRPEKKMVRYIRDSIGGNTVNNGNHWTEVEALMLVGNEYVNVALGKTVSCSNSAGTNLQKATDGGLAQGSGNYASVPISSSTSNDAITIDLGAEYPIDYVRVWHWYEDGRSYKNDTLSVGTELVGGLTGNAPLETVLWRYTGQAYVETSQGKRSKWIQENSVVEG